jgi:flagellar biosynthesis chaperone FliJ
MRQLELALAERERQTQEESIAAMEMKLVEELAAHLQPELLEHRARFTVATHGKLCSKREHLRTQVEACHAARAVLLKARVDTKKFETHKDSHLAEVALRDRRVGQGTADEAARQVFLRRQEACGNED